MPFDFDLEEDAPSNKPAQETEAEQQLYGALEVGGDDLGDEFSEAERRFEKAQFYRILLRQGIFEEASETSNEVEAEIRQFIRERLSVLLGITADRPKQELVQQFTEDEARVLKEVAQKLGAKKTPTQAAPPKLKTVAPTPVPAPKTKPIAPAPAVKPVLVTKPNIVKPVNKPQPPPAPPANAPKPPGTPGRKKLKKTGETLTVDGVEYTKVSDSDGHDFYVNKEGQKFRVGTNEAGQYFMRNITVQAVPDGLAGAQVTQPMTRARYEAEHAASASMTLRAAENNPLINTILGGISNR